MPKKILISIAKQTLTAFDNDTIWRQFVVSTAKNGAGQQENTGCTPLGRHITADKIGDNAPMNSVFVGRVPTGEIYGDELEAQFPDRDWILTRIIRLKGLEQGYNLGCNEQGSCDTYERYIYIHGTPDKNPMGVPLSHGCIRMRNDELVALYEWVDDNIAVEIRAC